MSELAVAILGGSAGAAVISGVFKLIEWIANRSAQKADRAEARADNDKLQDGSISEMREDIRTINENVKALVQTCDDLIESNKETLGDRIKHLALKYIAQGFVYDTDLEDLMRMHKVYHDKLNGNGFYDALMKNVKELPIKKKG